MARLDQKSLWTADLAHTLRSADAGEIWRYVFRAFGNGLGVTSLSVIKYLGDAMPIVLFNEAIDDPSGRRIVAYLQGAYLLDPFFHAILHERLEGCYSLKDVSPDGFKRSEYYRTFFSTYGLVDEIDLFFRTSDAESVAVSLGRDAGSGAFDRSARDVLKGCYEFLGVIVEQFSHQVPEAFELGTSRADFHSTLKFAIGRMATSVLTHREKTIFDYLLRGYSVKATAARLGISDGTVRIHRHSIYNKLDVRSQAELFALVVEALKLVDPASSDDPIEGLLQRA